MRGICLTIISFFLLSAGLASAQTVEERLEAVLACQAIEDESERLSCFDNRAQAASEGAITSAKAAENVAPSSKPEATAEIAEAEEKEARLPIWARIVPGRSEEAATAPNEFTVTIARVIENKAGRLFFESDDGLAWRQIEVERVFVPKELPATATLRKASFGTQFLSFNGRRATRVKRFEY